jgi:hypothetical protein
VTEKKRGKKLGHALLDTKEAKAKFASKRKVLDDTAATADAATTAAAATTAGAATGGSSGDTVIT